MTGYSALTQSKPVISPMTLDPSLPAGPAPPPTPKLLLPILDWQ
jgi:hypothetical protein